MDLSTSRIDFLLIEPAFDPSVGHPQTPIQQAFSEIEMLRNLEKLVHDSGCIASVGAWLLLFQMDPGILW